MEKEVTEQQRRLQVKKKYLERIQYVLGKGLLDQRDLYITIRGFFSEFLKLEYEFTYEELSLELNKVFIKPADKLNIDNFLYDLSESEYLTDRNLEQEEIKAFLGRLQSIIESLISDTFTETKKASFFDKLLKKKTAAIDPITEISIKEMDVLKDESPPIEMPKIDPMTLEPKEKPIDFLQNERENSLLKAGMFLTDIDSSNIQNPQDDRQDERKEDRKNESKDEKKDKKKDEKKASKKDEKKNERSSQKSTAEQIAPSELILAQDTTQVQEVPKLSSINSPIIDPLILEDNNPEIVKIHELMEESYNNININNIDEAKLFYIKALELYHKLTYENKNIVYAQLYRLYNNLKQ